MSVFTEKEVEYLKSQRLGRMATVSPAAKPHVVPVGFRFDSTAGTLEIGGHNFGKSKKFKDLQNNPAIAFVVDDLASVTPWMPRGIEIRGYAELFEDGGQSFGTGWDKAWIRLVPRRIVAWGIDTPPFSRPNTRSVNAGTQGP